MDFFNIQLLLIINIFFYTNYLIFYKSYITILSIFILQYIITFLLIFLTLNIFIYTNYLIYLTIHVLYKNSIKPVAKPAQQFASHPIQI
jgi:hypothetical protein